MQMKSHGLRAPSVGGWQKLMAKIETTVSRGQDNVTYVTWAWAIYYVLGDHGISLSGFHANLVGQQRPSPTDCHEVLPLQPHKRFDFRQARVLQACRSCPPERSCRTSHKRGQLHIVMEWRYHAGEVVF